MSTNDPGAPASAAPTADERAAIDTLAQMYAEAARGIGALQALQMQTLAAAAAIAEQQAERLPRPSMHDMPHREAAAELAVAARMSDRSMQGMMSDAAQIAQKFPTALQALSEGRISRGHLHALADAGISIEDAAARTRFEDRALRLAEKESVGRFRSMVKMVAKADQPRTLTERHRIARERRSVSVRELTDGMAELNAVLPNVLAHGIFDRLTQQAREIAQNAAASETEDPGEARDERTFDQVRADLLADMLLTAAPAADPTHDPARGDGPGGLGAIRALVQVTVPALALAGVDERGAELDGRSPIDADTARRLAARAPGWDRVLTHPITGAVLAVDRYRPNADLTRFLGPATGTADSRDAACRRIAATAITITTPRGEERRRSATSACSVVATTR